MIIWHRIPKQFHGPLIQSRFTNTQPLVDHLSTTLDAFTRGYLISRETGEIYWAAGNLTVHATHSIFCGRNLAELSFEFHKNERIIQELNQPFFFQWYKMFYQMIDNLSGQSDDPFSLLGKKFSQENLSFFEDSGDRTVLHSYNTGLMYLNYFMGNYTSGAEQIQIAKKNLDAATGKYMYYTYHVYGALLILANLTPKSKIPKSVIRVQKLLVKWISFCPTNFQHLAYWIEAEVARSQNNSSIILFKYAQAIELAKKNSFIHEVALILERCGSYCLQENIHNHAKKYLQESFRAFEVYGAAAKCKLMKEKYADYLSKNNEIDIASDSWMAAFEDHDVDLNGILKATSVISGEVQLASLLKKMTSIVVENAGAERGVFITSKDNELSVVEECYSDQRASGYELPILLSSMDLVASSVILYTSRTRQSVVTKNAVQDPRFINDSYIKRHRPISILCVPIIQFGNLTAIIYLENNLIADAFKKRSVNLIQVLSGQIAISLNNARIYEELEQKVAKRTTEIELEKKKSDELLLNILPATAAEELKMIGKSKTHQYQNTSVLFSDFVEFTEVSEKLSPSDLVTLLKNYFSRFDEIITNFSLEKIKTIGDSYLAVGGMADGGEDSAIRTVRAGLALQEEVSSINKIRSKEALPFFEMRVGIHSGSVIAGVVGAKKFAYDIWGDTVNTASRIESKGENGRVNISESTYMLIKDHFQCYYRGEIQVKGKGPTRMYFVNPLGHI